MYWELSIVASDDDVIRHADELASCTRTARILLPSSVRSSCQSLIKVGWYRKALWLLSIMIWTKGKRTLNIHYFRQLGHFLAKSRKNANFKNHVKNSQLMKLLKPYVYINFVSITFCKQNCASLPSSLFLKTGVKVAAPFRQTVTKLLSHPQIFSLFAPVSPLPPP